MDCSAFALSMMESIITLSNHANCTSSEEAMMRKFCVDNACTIPSSMAKVTAVDASIIMVRFAMKDSANDEKAPFFISLVASHLTSSWLRRMEMNP